MTDDLPTITLGPFAHVGERCADAWPWILLPIFGEMDQRNPRCIKTLRQLDVLDCAGGMLAEIHWPSVVAYAESEATDE